MDRLSFGKVIYHPERIVELIKTGTTYPVHLDLGLVNFCNHDCIWCSAGSSKRKEGHPKVRINKNKLFSSLNEMHSLGLLSCTLVGSGEPTLHPDFTEIISTMKTIGIEIGLFTNGSRINEEMASAIVNNLTFVRISLNGATKDMHNKIHKTRDFDKIINNVKALVKMKKGELFPTIGIQMGVHHINYEQIPDMADLGNSLNVDYLEFKPVYYIRNKADQIVNFLEFENVEQMLDDAEKQSDKNFNIYTKKDQFRDVLGKNITRNYNECFGSFFSTSMDQDGNLFMCDNQLNSDFLLGNVFEQGFKNVWHSQRRKDIYNKINLNQCPSRCRMHPLNEILGDIKHPDKTMHPNFL